MSARRPMPAHIVWRWLVLALVVFWTAVYLGARHLT